MHTKYGRAPFARALAALGLILLPTLSLAASGTALGVRQDAELVSANATKVLTVGADVFIGDKVVTGTSGQVQIKFSDKTELVVGPNSALTIEDYLLRDDNSAGKFAIKALSGTFRFATGLAPKDRYLIETPTGTIGVRGTAFDFTVGAEGTRVLLFHGAVELCNLASSCVTLEDICEVGAFDLGQSGTFGIADNLGGAERKDLKGSFKYAQSQSPLLREFWVPNARECFNKGFVAGDVPESLMPVGDGLPPPPDGCWYDSHGHVVCN